MHVVYCRRRRRRRGSAPRGHIQVGWCLAGTPARSARGCDSNQNFGEASRGATQLQYTSHIQPWIATKRSSVLLYRRRRETAFWHARFGFRLPPASCAQGHHELIEREQLPEEACKRSVDRKRRCVQREHGSPAAGDGVVEHQPRHGPSLAAVYASVAISWASGFHACVPMPS